MLHLLHAVFVVAIRAQMQINVDANLGMVHIEEDIGVADDGKGLQGDHMLIYI